MFQTVELLYKYFGNLFLTFIQTNSIFFRPIFNKFENYINILVNMAINLHFSSRCNPLEEPSNNDESDSNTSNTDLPDLSNSIHLLPCFIDYNGEAAVEKYFHKYISVTKNSNSQIEYTGSFRGYPLKGGLASSPEGFSFALMKDMNGSGDIESRTLKECERFDKFTCWNVSDTPTPRDPLFKALKWVDVAKIIHED
ncbi:hypothetical protein Avbf_12510 [Armadillidium vulgare]|nr:hypothetical protein Avbf_12510 [Armadillidium vulgare]